MPLSVGLDASNIPRCRAVQMGGRRSPWALIALMDTEKVQEQTEGRARARGAPPAGLGQLPGEPLPGAAIPGVSGASPGPSRSILSVPAVSTGQSLRLQGVREGRTRRPGFGEVATAFQGAPNPCLWRGDGAEREEIPGEGAGGGGSGGRGRQSPPWETRAPGGPGREERSCGPSEGTISFTEIKAGVLPDPDTAVLLLIPHSGEVPGWIPAAPSRWFWGGMMCWCLRRAAAFSLLWGNAVFPPPEPGAVPV